MGLESVTYISDLVATNPVGATDQKSQGDDHIRNIKSALLATFPNITGAVTLTHGEINDAAQLSAAQTFAEANTFTKALTASTAPIVLSSTQPGLHLTETDAGADATRWIDYISGGERYFSIWEDTPSSPLHFIKLVRTAFARTEIELNATTFDLNGALDLSGNATIAGHLYVTNSSPRIYVTESDAGSDEKLWRILADGDLLSISTRTDADGAGSAALVFSRTGTAIDEIELNATLLDFNGQINYNGTVFPPVEAKYKDGDETVNGSATLQDDDDLTGFTLETGEYYEIEAVLFLTQANATPDIKLTLTFTNAPAIYAAACDAVHDGAALDATSGSDDPATAIALDTSTGSYVLRFRAVVVANGTTGGTFKLQWAQNSSHASNTVLKQGSYMKAVKLSH